MMKKYTLIAIDDEEKARENIVLYVRKLFPDVTWDCRYAENIADGLTLIKEYDPDLIFLDLRMQNEMGFDLISRVENRHFEVIFVTAYSEYMDECVNMHGCLGYLTKPIEGDKLRVVMERFMEQHSTKKVVKFVHQSSGKRIALCMDDIVFLKAESNYVRIVTNEKSYVLSKTLKDLESDLPKSQFLKVCRSEIVNVEKIKNVSLKDRTITLKNRDEIFKISRSNVANFSSMFW